MILQTNKELLNNTRVNFNLFYRGIVVSVDDPLELGRAQIRVPSIHGANRNNPNYVEDSALPWATPAIWANAGNDMGEFNPPTPGNRVFITYEAGNSEFPIYFGGIPTKIGNTKYYKPEVGVLMGATQEVTDDDLIKDIKNGTERVLYKSFKGATIIVDDFDGDEYIRIIDQSGQTFTMGHKGDILPRRGDKLGTSEQSYMELTNNRGEKIRIEEGKVIIDGAETQINSPSVKIPHWSGGGGGPTDAYTKAETNALLENKSRVFFGVPTTPYQVNDLWYNNTKVYKCVNSRSSGKYVQSDWVLDAENVSPTELNIKVSQSSAEILDTVSNTYATSDYVDSKLNYEVSIISSNGDIFKNNVISTVLKAQVRSGNEDITHKFNDDQFIWSRSSDEPEADIIWNRNHMVGSKTLTITNDDVTNKATFNCHLIDTESVVQYIKTGLIEIFDGYDEPFNGAWLSAIMVNEATLPASGVTYDDEKKGYKFTGTSNYLNIVKPISMLPNYTFEFVTDLKSYTDIQNILSSNETDNNNVQNRFAVAVAGHLQVKKQGYTVSLGNVRCTNKVSVSISWYGEDFIDVYYNGDYIGRSTQTNWTSVAAMLTQIGRYCNGYIHCIRVYNRVLNSSEVKTNYNIDKVRFNLS